MRKYLIMAAAVCVSAASVAPAMAQDWRPGYADRYGYDYGRDRDEYGGFCDGARAHRIERQINEGQRSGAIDWRWGRYLHDRVDQTEDLQRRYCAYGGLNGWERRDLDRRYDSIEAQLRSNWRWDRGDDGDD